MKKICLALAILTALSANILAGDLYKISLTSFDDANLINRLDIEPVLRLNDGYLILTDNYNAKIMQDNGIAIDFVGGNVRSDELFIDLRRDEKNRNNFSPIFERDELRLFQLTPSKALSIPAEDIMPIRNDYLKIEYKPQRELYLNASLEDIDLETLIGNIETDSLISYTERLQAFYRRLTGTDSCYAARDWIKSKFEDFGFTDVSLDSFAGHQIGDGEVASYNVVAVKPGSLYPNRQIVIGGHYDAVPNCPGADDNGSGTAGTLEIARVLQDIETDVTFIFIAFDSEESGLHGSWHYADSAAARGDSIIYMLNMDMIADIDNDSIAKLYHSTDIAYSQLWAFLADSLSTNLTGVLSGSSGRSDHYPFFQNGYDATFVHEWEYSDHYHQPSDSTTYMKFDYMTRMVKASLATTYVIGQAPLPVTITAVRDGGDGQSMQVEWDNPEAGRIANFIVNYDQVTPSQIPLADTISGDSTRWLIDDLTEGNMYNFYIIAIDNQGKTSIASNKIKRWPSVKPRLPEGLSAMPVKEAVKLTWLGSNDELDFNHYAIIRDEELLPDLIFDTFFIDNSPSLGTDFHDYYVVAVDNDGYASDTTGIGSVSQKAAALYADKILAVNRSLLGSISYVDVTETGRFMRDALDGYDYTYYPDTVHTIPGTSVKLSTMIDYGLIVVGCESARRDDIGETPSLGGILESIANYLSIGGKVVIFGRWGDINAIQEVSYIYYQPGAYDYYYAEYFNIAYRIIPKTFIIGENLYSDFIGAHSVEVGYPDLEWDSVLTVQHTGGPFTVELGIPAPSLPVFAGAKIDTLYTYNSAVDSTLTEDHPLAWRYNGPDYQYIYFDIPLSFMKRDQALIVLEKAVYDLMNATAVEDEYTGQQLPASFSLSQNYPNPFNPGTTIKFYNNRAQAIKATLEVYNILGQKVIVLFDGKALPGVNTIEWNGRDADGRSVASGIYFYNLRTLGENITRKMVLLK